ncbi:FAS-associated factor 2-like protein [Dinothrombium tinctorium]|uniref:FAS-associated factor 2-like protein n=1 Tax=Dinothrombium tinctorium TaxID=1965070 RepID=A0A3S3PL09_9ACAR|nr:FAS-associated factor 2-like protein [Dinothrombium tinctorium]RWS14740.1 FAS-associated factor 2-like protein [Dinothrombium tinctorium]
MPNARNERSHSDRELTLFSSLFRLFSYPISFVCERILSVLRYAWSLVRPDPRRIIVDPLSDVLKFVETFEQKYGNEHPVFYLGTYSQALNDAKKELKFLLVYLHSEQHQDTDDFCRNVLTHSEVVNYINRNNILFWACSVQLSEGYRVSQALRENTYPFLALIALKDNRMTVIKKFEGKTFVERLLSQMQQSIEDNEGSLVAARLERQERSLNHIIRQQQDEAYLESLKADQEKERKKQEEKRKQDEALKAQREREMCELNRKERLMQLRQELVSEIPNEPQIGNPDAVKIVVKLPNGTRLERNFLKTHSIKCLYYFVFCNDQSPLDFQITTNFPRRELPCKPKILSDPYCSRENDENTDDLTLAQFGLGKSEMLFVHDLEA